MTKMQKHFPSSRIAINEKSPIIAYNKSFVAGIHIRAVHIYIEKYKKN